MKIFSSAFRFKVVRLLAPMFCCVFILAACTKCSDGGTSTGGTSTTSPPPALSKTFAYPLKVGPTSRYLVDQNGQPFLLVGDAGWALFAGLLDSEADVYLENRKQRGFTAIIAGLIEHKFAKDPPKDAYGFLPFTGQTFTTPNEDYFAHVDHIMKSAAAKGILVFLDPLYLGYQCGSEGWCAEVQLAASSDMFTWGQYVGNRYKDYDNIVWLIGGDTDPTPVQLNVQAMVDGILSVDSRHLFSAHNDQGMAITPWLVNGVVAPWLKINNVYTYTGNLYELFLTAYSSPPLMPVFFVEAPYENSGPSLQQLRAQSYWTVLSGGFGHVFGNCPMWGFGFTGNYCSSTNPDWKAQLNSAGAVNMQHFQALFSSRHWHTLIPDTGHTVLTGGYGSFGQSDYATAASASDGSSIIVYLPTSRKVTVSGASLAGSTMIAWWYNPSTGVATQIGTYSTTGPQNFTPPSSGDWVLVLDSTNFSFPPPGSK